MKGRHKVEALVLASRKIGEADRRVTLFTREHGILEAVAKGVRRVPSRRGGHLEPFTKVLALVSVTRAGTYIGAVETLDYFPALRRTQDAMEVARTLSLTVMSLFTEHQVEPELFDALLHAWNILPDLAVEKRGMLEVAVLLFALRRAGLTPDLRLCHVCGIKQPEESIVLDPHVGGWRCLTCHHAFSGTRASLPPTLLKVLRFLHFYPARALRVRMDEFLVEQLIVAVRYYVAAVADDSVLTRHISYAR